MSNYCSRAKMYLRLNKLRIEIMNKAAALSLQILKNHAVEMIDFDGNKLPNTGIAETTMHKKRIDALLGDVQIDLYRDTGKNTVTNFTVDGKRYALTVEITRRLNKKVKLTWDHRDEQPEPTPLDDDSPAPTPLDDDSPAPTPAQIADQIEQMALAESYEGQYADYYIDSPIPSDDSKIGDGFPVEKLTAPAVPAPALMFPNLPDLEKYPLAAGPATKYAIDSRNMKIEAQVAQMFKVLIDWAARNKSISGETEHESALGTAALLHLDVVTPAWAIAFAAEVCMQENFNSEAYSLIVLHGKLTGNPL